MESPTSRKQCEIIWGESCEHHTRIHLDLIMVQPVSNLVVTLDSQNYIAYIT